MQRRFRMAQVVAWGAVVVGMSVATPYSLATSEPESEPAAAPTTEALTAEKPAERAVQLEAEGASAKHATHPHKKHEGPCSGACKAKHARKGHRHKGHHKPPTFAECVALELYTYSARHTRKNKPFKKTTTVPEGWTVVSGAGGGGHPTVMICR